MYKNRANRRFNWRPWKVSPVNWATYVIFRTKLSLLRMGTVFERGYAFVTIVVQWNSVWKNCIELKGCGLRFQDSVLLCEGRKKRGGGVVWNESKWCGQTGQSKAVLLKRPKGLGIVKKEVYTNGGGLFILDGKCHVREFSEKKGEVLVVFVGRRNTLAKN